MAGGVVQSTGAAVKGALLCAYLVAIAAAWVFLDHKVAILIAIGVVWLAAVASPSPAIGIALFAVLCVYRLAAPTIGKSALFSPTVADTNELLLAFMFVVRWPGVLRGAGLRVWVIAALVGQLIPDLASMPTSMHLSRSLGGLLLNAAQTVIIVGVAAWTSKESSRLEWVLRSIVFAACIAAALALVHFHGPYSDTTAYAVTTTGEVVRISGVSGNFLSGLLLVAYCIVFGKLVECGYSWQRIAGVALFVTTIVLTYVRGALIDLVVVTLVILALGRLSHRAVKRLAVFAAVAGVMIAAVFLTANPVHSRISQVGSGQSTVVTRFQLWSAAWHIFVQRPLLGVGVKNFNLALNTYYPAQLPSVFYQIFQYPEQQLLGLADETGLIGLAAYEGTMLWLASALLRKRRDLQPRWIALTITAVMIGRIVSEAAGTWLNANDFLLLVSGCVVGMVCAKVDGSRALDGSLTPALGLDGPQTLEDVAARAR